MFGLCRLLLRDAAEAEDATQQAFASAYRSLLAGVVPREPAAWLATIARNECRARARSRMRAPLTIALPPDLAAPIADGIESMDLAALRDALAALPQRQRDAFLLRELGGLTYAEVAAALGVSVPAIESLLVRARTRLRVALAPLREAAPALGRMLPWPFAAKLAAATVGASLFLGSSVAVSREDGGPARADPLPAAAPRAVDRPRRAPPAPPIVRAPAPAPSPAPLRLAVPAAEHESQAAPEREHETEQQDGGASGDSSGD